MILSATSRSLLSQDMGGDGFSKEIADANLRNAGAHIQSARSGSPDLETLKRPPVRNGHDLTATRALVCIGGGKKERGTKSLPGLARTINGHDSGLSLSAKRRGNP